MKIYGTCYFATFDSAVSYYWTQENDETSEGHKKALLAVATKLKEGSIDIGKPPIKPGQKIRLNLMEGRYFIQE